MTKTDQKIPEGWSVKALGEIFDTTTDYVAAGSFSDLRNNINYIEKPDYAQLIRTVDVKNNFCNSDFVYINQNAYNFLWRVHLDKNSIILPNIGANIGEIYYITPSSLPYSKNALGPNAILLRSSKEDLFYLYCFCQTSFFKKSLDLIVGSSGQPKFNKTDLKNIKIPLPPLPEQEKIAEILGCWDNGIEKLSRLIEQKKRLKKGLMQRLLSGKQRLPGFSDPWKKTAIRDFCDIKRGGSPRPIENYLTTSDDGLNWLKIGDISPDAKYIHKTESKIKKEGLSKTTLIHSGDFILSNSMSFGRPYIMKIEACIHDGWLALANIKKDVSKEYLFYLLIFSETQKKFEMCAAGSGVRNLNKDIVGEISINLPSLPEQKAIADILSKADEEITLLTEKLSTLKSQKKGLMQKLLTGQIRIKVA